MFQEKLKKKRKHHAFEDQFHEEPPEKQRVRFNNEVERLQTLKVPRTTDREGLDRAYASPRN